VHKEFANPESSRDGGLSGKGEYAGRGLFVGGYKPITEVFGKAFKYSNSNKDDRIKRSKTVRRENMLCLLVFLLP